ncbi:hypothetical protein VB711_25195, partial [Cronbergia sp. UHCC 0137]|uniref:hypothetical protein n=1 Tax=Cronbergia sp. UHCC 0137 TaxID=3110239 RepID=UPI002B219AF5
MVQQEELIEQYKAGGQSEYQIEKVQKVNEDLVYTFHGLTEYLTRRDERDKQEALLKATKRQAEKDRQKALESEALEKVKKEGIGISGEFQKIHWSEFSSPCKKNIHSSMVLLPDGMIEQKIATGECLKGQKKSIVKNLEVTYDKDYVVEWLKVKVISQLEELPLETIQALVAEAYKKSGK